MIESISIGFIKLTLKFNPMQSQCMQEAFHNIHAHQNTESDAGENEVPYNNEKNITMSNSIFQTFVKKHFRQLPVS